MGTDQGTDTNVKNGATPEGSPANAQRNDVAGEKRSHVGGFTGAIRAVEDSIQPILQVAG